MKNSATLWAGLLTLTCLLIATDASATIYLGCSSDAAACKDHCTTMGGTMTTCGGNPCCALSGASARTDLERARVALEKIIHEGASSIGMSPQTNKGPTENKTDKDNRSDPH